MPSPFCIWNLKSVHFPNFFVQQAETSIFRIWHLVHVISLATFLNIAPEEGSVKKADVFLGKFLLITSAGKIFKVPSILLFEPGMLLPFVMLGLLINSHLLPLRKIGELLEILFPLPFFISWQKLMPFEKSVIFQFPF